MRRTRIRRREDHLSLVGSAGLAALAGFAAGVYLMQRLGGIESLLTRLSGRKRHVVFADDDEVSSLFYEMDGLAHDDGDYGTAEDVIEEDAGEEAVASEVAQRVLSAFLNDPVLCKAAVEISAESDGLVKLDGWVDVPSELEHAATIAGGVPGVVGIANRLRVRRPRRAKTR
jgi:osmotically-inducible protein OsmY